ncbi:BZIP domain-containing protein [Mycena indigotica]|uniref:BZIP domain-containing protein n=1 Tax=Mycena indigotica TaxID=2126181 RepID=A0A8H6SFG6_9AGAR|nr:BZIP domain-containing protein [Mycena indigotica]KAF7298558.1 BZIP domain-containing protein [Mycena indigotica]
MSAGASNGIAPSVAVTDSLRVLAHPPTHHELTLHDLNGSQFSRGTLPSSYLTMPSAAADHHRALQAIKDLTASPEFQSVGDSFAADFSAYADEPLFDDDDDDYPEPELEHDDSPSPHDTPYTPYLTTPLLDMEHDLGPAGPYTIQETELAGQLLALPCDISEAVPVADSKPPVPPPMPTEKLLVFSPSTPMLDSFDAFPSTAPVIPPPPARSTGTRRLPYATGTRKGITPADLIPRDAPTQRRTYRTPSATSRKAVPASLSRKRLHSSAFGHEDDYEAQSALQKIVDKRRSNTLAARDSRRRKVEHILNLEATVDELKTEVGVWRERANMAQALLKAHGVMLDFGDAYLSLLD